MPRNSKNKMIIDEFGILLPEYTPDPDRKPVESLADVLAAYPAFNDPYGNPARQVECFGRYYVTGVIERCHPLGETDCTVKSGVTLEFKTGHGWVIEPCFETLEELKYYVKQRTNPMLFASHIAYLPARANDGYDASKCIVMSARKFIALFGATYKHLEYKENRGRWGIAMKPWIREGYVQKPSANTEKAIMADLLKQGETLEAFTRRMGLHYYG